MIGCPFCREDGATTAAFSQVMRGRPDAEELLFEAETFVVMVDVAPIVPGHALIVPKTHRRSVENWWLRQGDIGNACGLIRERLSARGGVAFFEHAIAEGEPAKVSCVEHAHIHVLPTITALRPIMDREDIAFRKLDAATGVTTEGGQYFALMDTDGEVYGVSGRVLPSQFIRRAVCADRGERFWNWRDSVDFSKDLKTFEKIEQGRELYAEIAASLSAGVAP